VNFNFDISGRATQSGAIVAVVEVKIPTASAQALYDGTIFGWMFIVDLAATDTENFRFASTEDAVKSRRPIIRWFASDAPSALRRRRVILSD